MNGQKINPHFILVIGVIGISCSAIFVKSAQAPSVITATYRLLWTVILLSPSALYFHRKEWRDVTKKDLIWCCLSGIFLAFHFSSWFASLKYTSVASSMAIMSTEVIFTALGFALFLKGKIGKKAWFCIILAVVGSVVIALTDQASATNALYGDFLALLGAICISGYTLIGRQQRGHLSNTIYTYMVYSACAITLLLMDAATVTPVFGWGWKELLIGLCLALFCTLLGHSLFNWCLKYLNPAYVASAKLCEPIASTALAVVLFSEVPSAGQLLGAIVLLSGVFMYAKLERKASESLE